MFFLKIQVA